jgi:ribose transport system substrate-binding protein
MKASTSQRLIAPAAILASVFLLAGCTNGGEQPTDSGDEKYSIAVLVGGADNAYQAAGVTGIQEAADAAGVEVTVFDGTFDPAKQYGQFQTVISSGTYDAILINPVDTSGIIPLVADAAAAGILVGTWNQPIGTDLTNVEPTVDDVTVQVMTPPGQNGAIGGQLAIDACAEADADPCQVALLNFMKGSTFDTAVDDAFFGVVDKVASIEVVTQVDTGATREGGLAAVQTLLTGFPDVDVIVGISQSITGGLQAIEASGRDDIRLISQGLTQTGAKEVEDGLVWAGTYAAPVDEGRIALEQIVLALKGEAHESGVDPATQSPCAKGVNTKNVTECDFQFDG